MDENLFYKGVDKSVVHGSRLNQTHAVEQADGTKKGPDAKENIFPRRPPYPFESGSSLLKLTAKHNVRSN